MPGKLIPSFWDLVSKYLDIPKVSQDKYLDKRSLVYQAITYNFPPTDSAQDCTLTIAIS